jgi:hypothetical protein
VSVTVVLRILQMNLKMMEIVLKAVNVEIFKIHRYHLGGVQNHVILAHYLVNIGLTQSLVASVLLSWMETDGKSGKFMDMVAVKESYCTQMRNQIDQCMIKMNFLGYMNFKYYYPMISNCYLHTIVSYTGHEMKLYWLSSD